MDRSTDAADAAATGAGARGGSGAGPRGGSDGGTSRAEAAAAAILDTVPSAMRAIRAQMRAGRPAGLSVPQFRTLLYIRRNPGTDLSGVAEHLGTSLPATSELVARLVAQGLLVREADPSSRRRMRLSLSPAGLPHLRDAEAHTKDWLIRLLEAEDPDRLDRLADALDHLARLMTDPRA